MKPPQNNLHFFFREKPGKKEINSAYWDFMPGFSSIDTWRRLGRACLGADRTPRRPPSQRTQVAAGRESRRGARSGACVPRACQAPWSLSPPLQGSGTPCALEREGDREGTLQALLTLDPRLAPWIQNGNYLRFRASSRRRSHGCPASLPLIGCS